MRGGAENLQSATRAALRVASRKGQVEVFVRQAQAWQLMRDRRGGEVRRETRELGVACRVQRGELLGFGAASGEAASAGEVAARLALCSLGPGHTPLPEPGVLGAVPTPPPQLLTPETLEALFHRLDREGWGGPLGVSLHRTQTLLARGEGFEACWQNQLLLAEWEEELVPGVVGRFSRVLPHPAANLAPSWRQLLPGQHRGGGFFGKRHLARVLLAPDVAAPLLVSLVRSLPHLAAPVSPAWELADLRLAPFSLLPMACDGEGRPAQDTPLLVHLALARRRELAPLPPPVRLTWERPPQPAPVHLWQKSSGETVEQALALLDRGFVALAPASEVSVDHHGRLQLLAVMGEVRDGRPREWGVGVLGGTLRRLLSGLSATPGPEEHVALGCIVTTPWLLAKHLEVS